MAKTYSQVDVLRHTGATKSQITRWVRERLVASGSGPGHHLQFSFMQLLVAQLAQQLSVADVHIAVMHAIAGRIFLLEGMARTAAVASEAHAHEALNELLASAEKDATRIGKAYRASRVQVARLHAQLYADAIADLHAWRRGRRPGPERDALGFFGFFYSFDAIKHREPPQLVAAAKGQSILAGGRGDAALWLNVGDTLRELESKTGDSLDAWEDSRG